MYRFATAWRRLPPAWAGIFLFFMPMIGHAQTDPAAAVSTAAETTVVTDTLETLVSFVKLRDESEAAKGKLRQEREKLESDLRTTTRNLENIAAGVDISRLRAEKQEDFNFQKEIFALLKPAFDEMKEMTSHVRQKSDLREKIVYYEERLPVIKRALANVGRLQKRSKDESLKTSLKSTAAIWRKQQAFMQSELQAARLQLDKLEAAETSITEASQSYLKSFFQKRGLYLSEALLLVMAILLLSRLSYTAMQRHIPGFRKKHRSFRVRLVELVHRVFTVLMVILGPMIVFYLVEDWMLFSLGILLLLGITLTLRHTLPRYWHQVQLFLNIGSVREGERILMDGLPWQVQQINVFTQ
jgi:hypothetical protein